MTEQADVMIPVRGKYRSNNGKGDYWIRILYASEHVLTCEHVGEKAHARRFTLPTWFLSHESCGWKLSKRETTGRPQP